ncbi:hypothetical protein Tco_0702598 [Tanacetum coccineum]|uniref:Uncharacterized protein n=1 Tax=Tanacetum coccineum TaxID=301880 RepID=A0ABQ4XXS4_9ASTR
MRLSGQRITRTEGPIFQDPPSLDYVPGPEEPEQAPPSPIYVPFISEPVYPEFLPKDDVLPAEEQPLPVAASPTTESPRYIPESDPEEDPEEDDEEDLEEDPADYPADKGDDMDDEEPSDDDDDDDAEEEEHLAPTDLAAVCIFIFTRYSYTNLVMSANSAITYTSFHSEARSWSIPSKDPYEEAARQLLEQAPRSPEYIPDPMELEDHVPVYIPEPEHPEDLVPAEDEAPTPPLTPFFLASRTLPLLPIPLPALSTSRRADIPEADTPPWKRLLLTTPRPECEVDVCTRECSKFCTQHHDAQKDRAAVRAEIEVLRRERLAYEQESMETRQALARSEAHCRALEARVTVLETEVHRHEWQRQAADDLAVQHIMRTQALEAGARVDTLEDTGSSS